MGFYHNVSFTNATLKVKPKLTIIIPKKIRVPVIKINHDHIRKK